MSLPVFRTETCAIAINCREKSASVYIKNKRVKIYRIGEFTLNGLHFKISLKTNFDFINSVKHKHAMYLHITCAIFLFSICKQQATEFQLKQKNALCRNTKFNETYNRNNDNNNNTT